MVTNPPLLGTPPHHWGFPCCIGFPCAYLPSPLPRWNGGVRLSLASPATAAFPVPQASRLPHYPFRGLLSVHLRYGLHARPNRFTICYARGFRRFVTSSSAPVATGWRDSCRVGITPTEKPCLSRHTAENRLYLFCTSAIVLKSLNAIGD